MPSPTSPLTLLLGFLATTIQAYKLPPSTFLTTQCSDSPKLGTPTFGNEDIIFTTCAERNISAPVEDIYDALLNFSEYPDWNSFVINVTTRDGGAVPAGVLDEKGFEMTFTTKGLLPLGLNSSSNEEVSIMERDLEGGMVNGWKFEVPGILRAEHVNVLVEVGGGVSRYVSWESYYGLLAPVTKVLEGNLKEGFERQADDLKKLVEG